MPAWNTFNYQKKFHLANKWFISAQNTHIQKMVLSWTTVHDKHVL